MKMLFGFVAAGALALGVSTSAQETKKMPAEHTMTGCLAKTGDAFTVTSTAEKGPKTIGIISSTANLAPHVGHKIDITGSAVPAADVAAMKPAPAKADHYMKLTAIKMVAATCP